MFKCYFCNNIFTQKKNVITHISEKRCKSELINNPVKINDLLYEKEQLEEKLVLTAHDNSQINNKCSVNNVNNNTLNMKVEIIVNSIHNLDVNYIEASKMKYLIEQYDKDKYSKNGKDIFNGDKFNILLSDYIKDIICNLEHPENHAIKYIKKKPPTYNSITEDPVSGNTVTVIKGLKDTCELLSDPILHKLKLKMKEFIKIYNENNPDYEFDNLYDTAINDLKKELNKTNVKRALNSVLKNDILNNIEMKLSNY